MTREDARQMRIHADSYKITKEEANKVWLAKDLSKKRELALEIISKLVYKNNYAENLSKMNGNKIDMFISNLILAQDLNKVIRWDIF